MSYKLKLGTFTKYVESTKQPTVTGWTEYDINFKDGTDVVNPTVTLSIAYSTVKAYNYAYMLDRYYWIESMRILRTGLCELKLKTDVLATYKSDIGSASLYILRSSQSYNGYIPDGYYPPTAESTTDIQLQDPDTVPVVDFDTGYYLVTIMGTNTLSLGGSEIVYEFTPDEFRDFIRVLYSAVNGFQLADVINEVVKAFGGNPQKLISGVVWVPYYFPGIAVSDVVIGSYHTNVSGEIVTDCAIDLATFSYSIPKHPKASSKGKYLNTSPYTNYTLGINCGGIIELDTTKLVDVSTIYVYRTLDVKGVLQTWVQSTTNDHQYTFAVVYGNMGVPIALNGNGAGGSTVSAITGAVGAVASVASGGAAAIAGAALAGVGSVASAISGSFGNTTSGAIAGIGMHGRLISTFYDIPGEDNTHNGRPYCQVTTPATLTGFMIASRGDVDIAGTLPEEEEIKRFLETGFYYE